MKFKGIVFNMLVLFALFGFTLLWCETPTPPSIEKLQEWIEQKKEKGKSSIKARIAKWQKGQRTDAPQKFIRCAFFIDEFGDEAISNKKTFAIAKVFISCLQSKVECIIISHYVLKNLLDRHIARAYGTSDYSENLFDTMPDLNEWNIYDLKNTQFYLFLLKKNVETKKYEVKIPIFCVDAGTEIFVNFPIFKFKDKKIEWNISTKTGEKGTTTEKIEKEITSKLEPVAVQDAQGLIGYVDTNQDKASFEFNSDALPSLFVTPQDILDSIKNEKIYPSIIKGYFGEEFDWLKSGIKEAKHMPSRADSKFKPEDAKTGIARLNLLDYIKSELPQYNFFIAGHGGYQEQVVGVALEKVPFILLFVNRLNTKLVSIFSCYVGGENIEKVLDDLKKSMKNWENISYILVLTSTNDSVTYAVTESDGCSKFFSVIENGVGGKKSINSWLPDALKPLYAPKVSYFRALVSNAPQIMVPGVSWFSLVDIIEDVQILDPVKIRKYGKNAINIKDKKIIFLRDVENVSNQLVISGLNAVDIEPSNLIKLFPFSTQEYLYGTSLGRYPAVISAKPGLANYIFEDIKIEKIVVKDGFCGVLQFLRDAFFISDPEWAIQNNFYIKSLSGPNDFKQLFKIGDAKEINRAINTNKDLYDCLGEGSKPEDITLKNVFIKTIGLDEIELIFAVPVENNAQLYFRFHFGKSFYMKFYGNFLKEMEIDLALGPVIPHSKIDADGWLFLKTKESDVSRLLKEGKFDPMIFNKKTLLAELRKPFMVWSNVVDVAEQCGYPDVEDDKKRHITSYAAEKNDLEFIKKYDKSLGLWLKDDFGKYPIYYGLNNPDIVKYFLARTPAGIRVRPEELVAFYTKEMEAYKKEMKANEKNKNEKISESLKILGSSLKILNSHLKLWKPVIQNNLNEIKSLSKEKVVTLDTSATADTSTKPRQTLREWLEDYKTRKGAVAACDEILALLGVKKQELRK